jgi:hypothetical protein
MVSTKIMGALRFDPPSCKSANQPGCPADRTNQDGLYQWSMVGPPQVGVTCAACHTGQLTYEGKRIRIDGGAGKFDFMAYIFAGVRG